MSKNEEVPIYKVEQICNKMVHLVNTRNKEEQKDVPKYKLPLGIQADQHVIISEFGMYQIFPV